MSARWHSVRTGTPSTAAASLVRQYWRAGVTVAGSGRVGMVIMVLLRCDGCPPEPRWPRRGGAGCATRAVLAVVSHPIPTLWDRVWTAVADGARRTTGPTVPCQKSVSARRVVVLPEPAGPSSASTTRAEPTIASTAAT
ncbi:hypothetical protein Cma02nite_21420 [Cellulomonas marina]|nr:hypothetical protein Cma02nite_21420 [Cellulomonas marina]